MILEITEHSDDSENSDKKTYLRLFNPKTGEMSGIHNIKPYQTHWVDGHPDRYRRLAHGSKVIFKRRNEESTLYIFDGKTNEISKIELENGWQALNYYFFEDTVVWNQIPSNLILSPTSVYNSQLVMFRLER